MDAESDGAFRPGRVEITPEILSLIAEIDEFKGAWRALGQISPDVLSGLRRVATVESVGSSTRIEGAALTDRQVERLLANLELAPLATRDEQEVAGYAEAMGTVLAHWESIDLTENHLKQLHRDLLGRSGKDERHRGDYKRLPNHVEAFGPGGERLGVVLATASPFDTPRLMAELVAWTRGALAEGGLHPLIVIAIFVVTLLEIHPFQDGNGRLSRLVTTLLLLRAGYAYAPYSSLESAVERTREAYYLALRRTQRTIRTEAPDWTPWLLYFLGVLKQQKNALAAKLERERTVLGALPALSARILELARERGRVTVADAAKATGVSRNTVKDHMRALAASGRIVRRGAGRGVWYALA